MTKREVSNIVGRARALMAKHVKCNSATVQAVKIGRKAGSYYAVGCTPAARQCIARVLEDVKEVA